MSSIRPKRRAELKGRASVFAALGDETRISRLAEGSTLTRQAITKHLRVLEGAGVVHGVRVGRESLFEFRPEPLKEVQSYLDHVSHQWERALARLKSFVEN
jgi:DNA-binding transcriptional ArsR family regulator